MTRIWRRCAGAAGRLGRALAVSVERYFADQCPQHAAGISYRVLFSIAPLAIVLVSVFSLVLGNETVHNIVTDTIVNALPSTATSRSDTAEAITKIAAPSGPLGVATLVVFVWAATGMMAAIRTGLAAAMHAEQARPMARGKLVDLALVVGAALLVLVSATLALLHRLALHITERADAASGLQGTALTGWFSRGIVAATSVAVVMLLYRFVPGRRLRIRDTLAGAITTTALLIAISFASGLIYDRVTRLSLVYGSLTAALVFLYSVYLYASALLFGGEVAAAWSAPAGAAGDPLVVQLKRAARGLLIADPAPRPTSPGDDQHR